MEHRTWRLVSATALTALAAASPTLAANDKPAKEPTVAIVSSALRQSPIDGAESATGVVDQSILQLFERAGCKARVINVQPNANGFTNTDLAKLGRRAGADWVVYPRLLSLSRQQVPGESITAGTFTELRVRVVDAASGKARTMYQQQLGHGWGTAPEETSAYGEQRALPTAVARAFQEFRPLQSRLMARGASSNPRTLAQGMTIREQVAGARQEIRSEVRTPARAPSTPAVTGKRVAVLDPDTGKQVGFAHVTGPQAELDRLQAVFLLRRSLEGTQSPIMAFAPADGRTWSGSKLLHRLTVERVDGVSLRPSP